MAQSLAFIGLGIMGGPMAGHLLAAGNRLTVHTRTRPRADDLLRRGAHWADSPAAAAREAQVLFLCLPDTPDVQQVLTGPGGVLESARPGLIVVDHSTISPDATRQLAAQLAQRGVTLLDAPISGGDVGAKNATLSIMVGGQASAFTAVEPLLHLMGQTITHTGPSGSGQLTKLTNQILVTLTNLAVCEALVFAQSNGLDPAKTLAAIGGGAAGSWQLSNLGPRMIKGDFSPGFMVNLQLKDLRLVAETAAAAKLNLPASQLVHHLFTEARDEGLGKAGTQALFQVVRRRAAEPPTDP